MCTWEAHLRKHGSALGIAQPYAEAARQKRRDARAQLFAQASLVPSDETKTFQHKTPFAMRLEEHWIELVVHSDAPEESCDAFALRDFKRSRATCG